MFSSRFYLRKTFILLVDFSLLFLSLFLALKIRALWGDKIFYQFIDHFQPFFIIFLVWLIVFYLFDLYNLRKIKSLSFFLSNLLLALIVSTVLSVLFFYIVVLFITPKTVLILIAGVAFILLASWRYIWSKVTRSIKPRVAVIGDDQNKIKVLSEILTPSETDYELVGFINLGQEQTLFIEEFNTLGKYHDLINIINEKKLEELIIAFDYHQYPEATKKVTECLALGIKITEMPLFYEEALGKIPVECIDQIWFLSQLRNQKKLYQVIERIFDIVSAALGLILFSPFFLIVILLIKIDSTGPIFYTQKRVGVNEKIFKLYKFRTMVKDAEKITGAVWSTKNDLRITKIGTFLRKTRIDEIPQLVNVLKGQMSIVGPRPERPEFIEKLKQVIPHYTYRHLVKPGLTGWAQIKYKYSDSTKDTLEKLQYDLYQIKNRSLLLYLIIIIRTIRIVLLQAGR